MINMFIPTKSITYGDTE